MANPLATVRKCQAIAGAVFSIFLLMHFSNILLANVGEQAFNDWQATLRLVYQNPVLEWLLVFIPLLVHVACGVYLIAQRKKRGGNIFNTANTHNIAGLILMMFIFAHISATRGVGFWFDAPAQFSGVAFSLHWVPAYFYPYYFLFFVLAAHHLSGGLMRIFNLKQGSTFKRVRGVVTLAAAVGAAFALASFGGHRFDTSDPWESDYAKAYMQMMGIETP